MSATDAIRPRTRRAERPAPLRTPFGAALSVILSGHLLLACAPVLGSPGVRELLRSTLQELPSDEPTEEQLDALIEDLVRRTGVDRRKLRDGALREFESRRKRYVHEFERVAGDLLRAAPDPGLDQEVSRLRADAIRVGQAEDSTERQIREVCDPALQRLLELLAIPRREVLGSSRHLAGMRDELAFLAMVWWRAGEHEWDEAGIRPALDALLAADEAFASVMAWELDPRDRRVMVRNRKADDKLDPREARAILLLNLRRLLLGHAALAIDTRLVLSARDHSRDMALLGFRGHDSPVGARSNVVERAERYGTRPSGENVAFGPPRAEQVIDLWWYSPSHHRVMTSSHTRIGVGWYDDYWTMVLGRSDRTPVFTTPILTPQVDDPWAPPPKVKKK